MWATVVGANVALKRGYRESSLTTISTFPVKFKGEICEKWAPFRFVLQTNMGQHITRVTSNWSKAGQGNQAQQPSYEHKME